MAGECASDVLSAIQEFEVVEPAGCLPDERAAGEGWVHACKIACKATNESPREEMLQGFSHKD